MHILHTHTHTNIACNVTRLFFFFASTMVDRMPGPILSFYSFSFMYFRSQSFRLVVPFVSDVLLFSRSFLARSDKLSRFMQSSILRLKKIEVKKKRTECNNEKSRTCHIQVQPISKWLQPRAIQKAESAT